MTIGLLRIEFILPEINSLKEKRSIIQRIKNKVRDEFNVSSAELEYLDRQRKALIGFATLSNDSNIPEQILTNIEEFIDKRYNILVTDRKIELF